MSKKMAQLDATVTVKITVTCADKNVRIGIKDNIGRLVVNQLEQLMVQKEVDGFGVLDVRLLTIKPPLTTDQFHDICQRAGELGEWGLQELRQEYSQEKNVAKAKEETQGLTRKELVVRILEDDFRHLIP